MRLLRFDELDLVEAERVASTLEPFISAERKARIEAVLARRTREVTLVLEDVSDDHNASAVLRTAEAFGLLEVHVVEARALFTIEGKTSSGAHKWLDVHRHPEPRAAYQALHARGYAIWAAGIYGQAHTVQEIDVSRPVALVFGNEHHGLSRTALESADGVFRVPMVGFVESLNVSVATAVSMYDVLARKKLLPLPALEHAQLKAAYYSHSVKAATSILKRASLPLPIMSRRPFAEMEREREDPQARELSAARRAATMGLLPSTGDG